MPEHFSPDVAVIGAGPAGLAAAVAAAVSGRRVTVVNDQPHFGGQIWRRDVAGVESARAAAWMRRAEVPGILHMDAATVVDARSVDGSHRLTIEQSGRARTMVASRIVLATGARELFLPFPGWTLPGVLGVGGLQAMAKCGLDVRGRRIVIAGSGPLLLAVAAALSRRGARVVMVAEQAPLSRLIRFAAGLIGSPATARDAIGYATAVRPSSMKFGSWVVEAVGEDRVRRAIVTDGKRQQAIDCDFLGVGYGLVPNTELARLVGCALTTRGIAVDERQMTTVDGVYAAGECVGIAGVDAALAEGTIAGSAASEMNDPSATLRRQRASARAWGRRLESTFALRPELNVLAGPDTIVCRCEDVQLGALDRDWSIRQAKLYTRVGMGACQGRVCGPALRHLLGWGTDRVRAPICPSFMTTLAASDVDHNPIDTE